MTLYRLFFVLMFSLLVGLSACSNRSLPAPTATAVSQPTQTATMQPTLAATAISAPTSQPTETAVPAATPAPTVAPAITPTSEPIAATATYQGVQFSYGPELASGATGTTIAAVLNPLTGLSRANQPETIQFSLSGYPAAGVFDPVINIYNTQALLSANAYAVAPITQLQTLLSQRPTNPGETELPYLPMLNAAQVFRTQVAYLDFNNGQGLRYITYYAQDASPVTSQRLFFTFQGLTNDNAYTISAVFPIATDLLPATTPDIDDWEAFAANYETYLQELVNNLDEQTAEAFTPNLNDLDALIHTLDVAVIPTIPDAPLGLFYPLEQGQALAGQPLAAAGFATTDEGEVMVSVWVGPNKLVETTAVVSQGRWSALLPLPASIVGYGRVVVNSGVNEAIAHINILDDFRQELPTSGPAIWLEQPVLGETAVAGYLVFFRGFVQNPFDNQVTIGVLTDECTRFAARISFTVGGTGSWEGQVQLPPNITDEKACAVAFTGAYGLAEWAERQTPLPIYELTDLRANRLKLATIDPQLTAGITETLSGFAAAPAGTTLSLTLQTFEGTVLFTGETTNGADGSWEIEIPVPSTIPDMVLVIITIPGATPGSDLYRLEASITIRRQ